MTKLSGAYDKKTFDEDTILLKISKENDKHRLVYIGGNKVGSFLSNDDVLEYISNMGKIITPYSIANGDEYIYFLTPYFKFFKRETINNDEIVKTNEKSVDPYDLDVSQYGTELFKKKI